MNRCIVGLVAVLAVLALAMPLSAAELGDPAPPLKVEKWIKGGPVDLEAGKGKNVYVVEFWATWCAPCRTSIRHLTELQKKYKDRGVVIVGISVDGGKKHKTRKDVEPYVKDMGEKMGYAVALDTEEQATKTAYMEAFLVTHIPNAFIVDRRGRIVWLGGSEDLEPALEKVLTGKYDLQAARKADQHRRQDAAKRVATIKLIDKYFESVSSDEKPEGAEQLGMLAFIATDNDPSLLNLLAWDILTREDLKFRDLKLALRAAKAANDATEGKSAAIVDTYARALFDTGKVKEAIEHQRKAVKLAEDNQEMRAELEKTLKRYEEAAGK